MTGDEKAELKLSDEEKQLRSEFMTHCLCCQPSPSQIMLFFRPPHGKEWHARRPSELRAVHERKTANWHGIEGTFGRDKVWIVKFPRTKFDDKKARQMIDVGFMFIDAVCAQVAMRYGTKN